MQGVGNSEGKGKEVMKGAGKGMTRMTRGEAKPFSQYIYQHLLVKTFDVVLFVVTPQSARHFVVGAKRHLGTLINKRVGKGKWERELSHIHKGYPI